MDRKRIFNIPSSLTLALGNRFPDSSVYFCNCADDLKVRTGVPMRRLSIKSMILTCTWVLSAYLSQSRRANSAVQLSIFSPDRRMGWDERME